MAGRTMELLGPRLRRYDNDFKKQAVVEPSPAPSVFHSGFRATYASARTNPGITTRPTASGAPRGLFSGLSHIDLGSGGGPGAEESSPNSVRTVLFTGFRTVGPGSPVGLLSHGIRKYYRFC